MTTTVPGPGYSVTMRVETPATPTAAADLTGAVGGCGGVVTAFDVVESVADRMTVDLTTNAGSADHAAAIGDAVGRLPGVTVGKVSDRTFLIHLGGKIEVTPKVPLRHRDDLSRAYTPGVARVCLDIAAHPENARRLTIKRNTVAVVTDGSAVLGLGDIGPYAALPVMEGKAALFKAFAGVDAWPVCLDTTDTEEIIRTVKLIAPVYGGINLEDISAPRCFEIERRLRDELDIPVFHDDQHGTAICVLAALRNALAVVGKDLADCRVVVSGVGAAGSAIIRLLQHRGPGDVVAVDIDGIVHPDRPGLDANLAAIAAHDQPGRPHRRARPAMAGADVFIGVSAPGIVTEAHLASMAERPLVFALANPEPEVEPLLALRYASVVATGRSDHPNQINNVLAFPGVFRGLLDSGATEVTDAMLLAAADALADVVDPAQRSATYVIPSVFDPRVAPAVSVGHYPAVDDDTPGGPSPCPLIL